MPLIHKKSFDDKITLVTGASSGIGRATALAFAREGSSVILADKLTEEGVHLKHEIENLGVQCLFIKCDVADEADIKNVINKTIETFGRIDCAFNNAGIEGEQAKTADCTDENWSRIMDVNLKGIWLCMKYEIPHMLKQGNGVIVNCASIAGLVGFAGLPAYVASKHGVIGLTKTAALEYAKSNIRINAVCPGVIQTPMIDRLIHNDEKTKKQLVQGEPMGRMGKPEEIAAAVIWLCSDAASFVTGHSMAVDGGWVAQ